jgi:hypothetical protein
MFMAMHQTGDFSLLCNVEMTTQSIYHSGLLFCHSKQNFVYLYYVVIPAKAGIQARSFLKTVATQPLDSESSLPAGWQVQNDNT